jgi:hypothetical protein
MYNVITNIKVAMAKRYIWETCHTLYDNTHKCDKTCSQCTATPPCVKDRSKYCDTCNRWFLSEKCFHNHFVLKMNGKLLCRWKQMCRKCNYTVTANSKHECNKRFCTYCNNKTFRPLLLRCSTANKQAFQQVFVRILRYGVHPKPWNAWWDFLAYTEPHMCSENVFCLSKWG